MISAELQEFLNRNVNSTDKITFLRDIKKYPPFLTQISSTLPEILSIIQSEELLTFSDNNETLGIQLYRQFAILYCCILQKSELAAAKDNFKQQLEQRLHRHHWTSAGASAVNAPGVGLMTGANSFGLGLVYLLQPIFSLPVAAFQQFSPSERRKNKITQITQELCESIEEESDINTIVEKFDFNKGQSLNFSFGFSQSLTAKAFLKSILEAIDNIENPTSRMLYLQKARDIQTPLGKFIFECYRPYPSWTPEKVPAKDLLEVQALSNYVALDKKIIQAERQCISVFLNNISASGGLPVRICEKLDQSLCVTENIQITFDGIKQTFLSTSAQIVEENNNEDIECKQGNFVNPGRSLGLMTSSARDLTAQKEALEEDNGARDQRIVSI